MTYWVKELKCWVSKCEHNQERFMKTYLLNTKFNDNVFIKTNGGKWCPKKKLWYTYVSNILKYKIKTVQDFYFEQNHKKIVEQGLTDVDEVYEEEGEEERFFDKPKSKYDEEEEKEHAINKAKAIEQFGKIKSTILKCNSYLTQEDKNELLNDLYKSYKVKN